MYHLYNHHILRVSKTDRGCIAMNELEVWKEYYQRKSMEVIRGYLTDVRFLRIIDELSMELDSLIPEGAELLQEIRMVLTLTGVRENPKLSIEAKWERIK